MPRRWVRGLLAAGTLCLLSSIAVAYAASGEGGARVEQGDGIGAPDPALPTAQPGQPTDEKSAAKKTAPAGRTPIGPRGVNPPEAGGTRGNSEDDEDY